MRNVDLKNCLFGHPERRNTAESKGDHLKYFIWIIRSIRSAISLPAYARYDRRGSMTDLLLLFFLAMTSLGCAETEQKLEVATISPKAYARLPFLIVPTDRLHAAIQPIAQIIEKDFVMGGQFEPSIKPAADVPKSQTDLKALWQEGRGYPYALFLSQPMKNTLEYRLYDTNAAAMLIGKRIVINADADIAWVGHQLADKLNELLTGSAGSWASLLVACKREKKGKKDFRHIYGICPGQAYDQASAWSPLVKGSTIHFGCRWHPTKPLLYFSEHTPYNVRLVSLDEQKTKRIVMNFDGHNMMPAISSAGTTAVSITNNGYDRLYLYHVDKKSNRGIFEPLTPAGMHAIAPSFVTDNQLVFCAIENHLATIMLVDCTTKKRTPLVQGGYNVAPVYCPAKNLIAYCKKIDGTVQVFTYTMATKENKQLTCTPGHKDECTWSPCGNYIAYSVGFGNESRIAIFSFKTLEERFITPKGEFWTFPAWSGIYEQRPFA